MPDLEILAFYFGVVFILRRSTHEVWA